VLESVVEIHNSGGDGARVRRLDLARLVVDESYEVSDGEQGFPAYIDDKFFAGIAHPAGWAMGEGQMITLRQHPARTLEAGESMTTMQRVLGVASDGTARRAFERYVLGRSRRVLKGHDRPYSIMEPFGSWDYDRTTARGTYPDLLSEEPTEELLLDHLSVVSDSPGGAGSTFDIYSVDFWVDPGGDLTQAHRPRFPGGIARLRDEIERAGMGLGLWMDTSWTAWSIGRNPVTSLNRTHDAAYGTERESMCLATDPYRSMWQRAVQSHVRGNRAKLLKFDNLQSICYNPGHEHEPGIYSTEAIFESAVDTLRSALGDSDAFAMLYWGYRSPWWLLSADTIYEPGILIEAAHPASAPTLHVRDSVIQGLDQAQWYLQDVPWLGKDSLGVWLSSWKWNSSIGTERWEEALVMDMCRGSLLAQVWSDADWLDAASRSRYRTYVDLLRANPTAFRNAHFVVGNPWRSEAYAYACSDSDRTFIAAANMCWNDSSLTVDPDWGLPGSGPWDVFRWHPRPARLTVEGGPIGAGVNVAFRPFEVVLLEIVRAGSAPSLGRQFDAEAVRQEFAYPTKGRAIRLREATSSNLVTPLEETGSASIDGSVRRCFTVTEELESGPSSAVVVSVQLHDPNGRLVPLDDVGGLFAARVTLGGQLVASTPVVRPRTYAAPWQAWRLEIHENTRAAELEMEIVGIIPAECRLDGHLVRIPRDRSDAI